MKFIIDAHLPRSVGDSFKLLGYEVIHTKDLPKGNATKDKDIIIIASVDGVVISKDEDFYQSFLLYGRPPKLVHVKVGNMKLKEVSSLFRRIAPKIVDLLGQHDLIEVHKDKIIAIA